MCTNTASSHDDKGHGKIEATEPQWKFNKIFYCTGYGAIVLGPKSVNVKPWDKEDNPVGVFLCRDAVPTFVEERESTGEKKGLRARILSPDNQWYWLLQPTLLQKLDLEGPLIEPRSANLF